MVSQGSCPILESAYQLNYTGDSIREDIDCDDFTCSGETYTATLAKKSDVMTLNNS